MMKRNCLSLFAVLAGLSLVLAGCAPAVGEFNNFLGGADQAAETALLADIGATNLADSNLGTALIPIGSSISGALNEIYNTTGQRIWIDFTAGYQIDAATVAGAFTFYRLANAANGTTEYTRGTAISYTSSVEGNRIYFDFDLTTASALIEMVIDASVLTARSGSYRLDTNGNGIWGEAADTIHGYQIVTQNSAAGSSAPPAVAIGAQRAPQATVTVTPTAVLATSHVEDIAAPNLLTFTVQDTGSVDQNLIAALGSAVTVYKMTAGVWTAAASQVAYDAPTDTATITLTTAPLAGETYKFVIDQYNVTESTAVRGYVHRASYDLHNTGGARYITRYVSFVNTGGVQETVTPAIGGADYARYIDITSAGDPFDMTTVTASNLQVLLPANTVLATGTAPAAFYVTYTVTAQQTVTFDVYDNAVQIIRLWLPANIKDLSAGYDVRISPSVMTLKPSGALPPCDNFGNVAGTDGWAVY